MELRQIRHLLAVADHGTYARAAHELGMTQSALTQSVARLEKEVGLKLLDRGRFGAVPTEAGLILIERGRTLDIEVQSVQAELDAFKGATRGDVAIGVGTSVTQSLVPTAISHFMRARPNAVVTAHEGWSPDLFERLTRGVLDFVVSAAVPQVNIGNDLRQELLFRQHETVVAGPDHPLARRDTVTLRDLIDWPWVMPPAGNGRVRAIRAVFTDAGLPPPSRFVRTDSAPVLYGIVTRTTALALATVELLPFDAPHLVPLPIPELTIWRNATLTFRRRSRLRPLAALLADIVRQTASGAEPRQTDAEPTGSRGDVQLPTRCR